MCIDAVSNNDAAGVDNTFWRKFDREEYLECAREHEQKTESRSESNSKGPPIQRKPLKHRDYEVVTPIAPLSQQAAYYCSVYECVVKSSVCILIPLASVFYFIVFSSYASFDFISLNQRALGMSMRVERASLEQLHIQERFELLKKRKDTGPFTEQDDRILKQQQEEEERKCQRRERKKEKKKAAEEETEVDADVAAMMGFADKAAIMVGGEGTRRQQPSKQK
ncbi:hypothetical protein CsSME_00011677 [Camellia sinensis var. sinensis]